MNGKRGGKGIIEWKDMKGAVKQLKSEDRDFLKSLGETWEQQEKEKKDTSKT